MNHIDGCSITHFPLNVVSCRWF